MSEMFTEFHPAPHLADLVRIRYNGSTSNALRRNSLLLNFWPSTCTQRCYMHLRVQFKERRVHEVSQSEKFTRSCPIDGVCLSFFNERLGLNGRAASNRFGFRQCDSRSHFCRLATSCR